jgi:hypothetical protein
MNRTHTFTLLCSLFALLALSTGCDEALDGVTENSSSPIKVSGGDPSQEFIDLHASQGDTPEGAFKLWLEASIRYKDGRRQEMHRRIQYLSTQLEANDWATKNSNATFVTRLREKNYIFRSYAEAATVENGYEMNPDDFSLRIDEDASGPDMFGDRGYALFVKSSGADSARPVYLEEIDGLYYLGSFSNIYVDIRQPQ